jgi:hypothetical protein
LQGRARFRLLDLTEIHGTRVDRLIGLKFPAYLTKTFFAVAAAALRHRTVVGKHAAASGARSGSRSLVERTEMGNGAAPPWREINQADATFYQMGNAGAFGGKTNSVTISGELAVSVCAGAPSSYRPRCNFSRFGF